MNKLQKWAHVRQDEVVLMWSPFHVCISSLNQNCCTNRMDPPSQAWTNARARTLSVISDIRCCKTQSATWLWIQMPAETRISIWCQRAPGTGKQKTTNNIFFSYNRATILQTSMCADGHSQINHRTIKSPCVQPHTKVQSNRKIFTIGMQTLVQIYGIRPQQSSASSPSPFTHPA